jgi:hypothetical protein
MLLASNDRRTTHRGDNFEMQPCKKILLVVPAPISTMVFEHFAEFKLAGIPSAHDLDWRPRNCFIS